MGYACNCDDIIVVMNEGHGSYSAENLSKTVIKYDSRHKIWKCSYSGANIKDRV
jgi:hypothetical protein